jgi:hypothetical protein
MWRHCPPLAARTGRIDAPAIARIGGGVDNRNLDSHAVQCNVHRLRSGHSNP